MFDECAAELTYTMLSAEVGFVDMDFNRMSLEKIQWYIQVE